MLRTCSWLNGVAVAGIRTIFNATVDIPMLHEDKFECTRVPVWDEPVRMLLPYFQAFTAAVQAARSRDAAVLVHCLAGEKQ